MTPRSSDRSRAGMRGGLPRLLRHLSSELEPGLEPAVRARVQTSIAEAVTAQTLEPVGQLAPSEKRVLLGALDRTLGHRSNHPDPRAVVELTEQLMPALPGVRGPALATPAPAR